MSRRKTRLNLAQSKRGYQRQPRTLNTSDLYDCDDFEDQHVNFSEDDSDHQDYDHRDSCECEEPAKDVVISNKEVAGLDKNDNDDGWSVVDGDEGDDECWSFADGQGTFLSAAVRAIFLGPTDPPTKSPLAPHNPSPAATTPALVANKEEHFDGVDEHWALKQKGEHRLTARKLHGSKRGH
ncbi:hypothetical protein BASA81_006780 [Batrachochytrium salamandrivorans]|nr:hypothetical protein BASA81_006780 [Batrachochytrium salamandrivorans]